MYFKIDHWSEAKYIFKIRAHFHKWISPLPIVFPLIDTSIESFYLILDFGTISLDLEADWRVYWLGKA